MLLCVFNLLIIKFIVKKFSKKFEKEFYFIVRLFLVCNLLVFIYLYYVEGVMESFENDLFKKRM